LLIFVPPISVLREERLSCGFEFWAFVWWVVDSRPQTAARQLICAHDYSRMESGGDPEPDEEAEEEDPGPGRIRFASTKGCSPKERRVDEQTDEMYSLMNRLCTGLTLEYTEENTNSL